jgi:hypothetical protein
VVNFSKRPVRNKLQKAVSFNNGRLQLPVKQSC